MIYKILDFAIIAIGLVFFVGVVSFEFDTIGFSEPILQLTYELKLFSDALIWPLVVLLIFDLTLKYRKVKDPKKFVKKYWIDIVMLALIPIFSAFKFFKIGLSLVKKLKTVKMGTKVAHKTKKITQSNKK
ncbi:hypothetical protein AAA799E16_01958 [Marine Group I thaumarchaeote SCGC AAA799-E16]|uniref:Uncharacterized protein n=4 Tax=Marine Group I TaxID=905826 RepID=A0A081RMW2_9ARCH|nr:hypothetical protein AAA799N04_01027 [Marine Group I thaumarchaeote SCGC AAA799-N04]KER05402.1 hypothetical protein AAA799E16_01958 [Marine Group I thaumarchaeote SCGC AAA799-E16]KFM15587.1 hypothetical protein AAA799D11_01192 [Marine Group I thaumarchaeote SCGC AAA799-D11]KFM16786.1 hypothetical protein SCCGRSA3_02103 [Marine Group I thaumarchaeote SCGC RSA3]